MFNLKKLLPLLLLVGSLTAGKVSEHLARMDQRSRENVTITLEPVMASTDNMQLEVRRIAIDASSPGAISQKVVTTQKILLEDSELKKAESLWNSGNFEDAIALINEIEQKQEVFLGISWKDPLYTADVKWGNDISVTPSSYDISRIELAKAMGNDNLFIIALGQDGGTYKWWIFMSSDGGYSWAQTYEWFSASPIADVDLAEMPDGYVYIAYGYTTNARVRRVDENTGNIDAGFGYVDAFVSPDTLTEVNIEPNRYPGNLELYYGSIDQSGNLLWYYSSDSGHTWNDYSPGITNAERGLDMDYGYLSSAHLLWISYISTADSLCAGGITGGGWELHPNLTVTHSYPFFKTAIAMHGDTIIVFYEDNLYTPSYRITYNDGDNWAYGSFYSDSAGAIDVTGRGDEGWHTSFATFAATGPEIVYYSHRNYPQGAWDTPVELGDGDAWIQYKTSIDYIGIPGAYGVAYIDDSRDVYFDRSDWTSITENTRKSNTLAFTSKLRSNGAILTFVLKTTSSVKLNIYDAKGSLVKKISKDFPAGINHVSFSAKKAGIYFATLDTGKETATVKFVIVK